MHCRTAAGVAAVAVLLFRPATAAAQVLAGVDTGSPAVPAWMVQWSPTWHPIMAAAAGPTVSPAGMVGSDRAGLFWTAGNPAGAVRDVDAVRADWSARMGGTDGPYRRPLDPTSTTTRSLNAAAWQPVTGQRAAAGRLGFETDANGDGSLSDAFDPYGRSPFSLSDTAGDRTRGTRTLLEGATAWRYRGVDWGVAAGYEGRERRTVTTPFPRHLRRNTLGVTGGLAVPVAGDRLNVGVHGQWISRSEVARLVPYAARGLALTTQGLREPRREEVTLTTLIRRMRGEARAATLSAGGIAAGIEWAVSGGTARYEESHWSAFQDSPPSDVWTSELHSAGLAVAGGRQSFGWSLAARWHGGSGAGVLSNDSVTFFTGRESAMAAEGRMDFQRDAWFATGTGFLTFESRTHTDLSVDLVAELETILPGLAVHAGRAFGSAELGVGFSRGDYRTRGSIPDARARGASYQRLIAPMIDLYAADASSNAVSGSFRYVTGQHGHVFAMVTRTHTAPVQLRELRPTQPVGHRGQWALTVGVSLVDRQ
jgi:hypothetical protein